jgi:hypothetical protein
MSFVGQIERPGRPEIAQAMPLPFLSFVPRAFFWIAATAWLATFFACYTRCMRCGTGAVALAPDNLCEPTLPRA